MSAPNSEARIYTIHRRLGTYSAGWDVSGAQIWACGLTVLVTICWPRESAGRLSRMTKSSSWPWGFARSRGQSSEQRG